MSLHMLGVIQPKLGVVEVDFKSVASCVYGTTCDWHREVLVRMLL